MENYKITTANKVRFKQAALRIMRELILADSIIDDDELNYFDAYCRAFNRLDKDTIGLMDSPLYRFDFRPKEILDSQSISLADALMIFKDLRKAELDFFGSEEKIAGYYSNKNVNAKYKVYLTVNFIGALHSLSRCDGSCDITEAKICIMLNYVLRKDNTFAFSFKNPRYRFAKNEMIYINNASTTPRMSQSDIRYITSRLGLFDYSYISIDDCKNTLLSKDCVIGSLLKFVYPLIFMDDAVSAKEDVEGVTNDSIEEVATISPIKLVREAISKITESGFINSIFSGTPLESMHGPYVLMKIGKSKGVKTKAGKGKTVTVDDFVCIPIDDSLPRFVDELTDDILVLACDVTGHSRLSSEQPLVIKGFVKTLLDYAMYKASEDITKIEIDLLTRKMRFGDMIPEVSLSPRDLSMYLLIAILSKVSNGLRRRPTELQLKIYDKLYTEISYRMTTIVPVLKIEPKHLTSNISTELKSSTLIKDVDALVPGKRSFYAVIPKKTLDIITVRAEIRDKTGKKVKKNMSLEQFWEDFLSPQSGIGIKDLR